MVYLRCNDILVLFLSGFSFGVLLVGFCVYGYGYGYGCMAYDGDVLSIYGFVYFSSLGCGFITA